MNESIIFEVIKDIVLVVGVWLLGRYSDARIQNYIRGDTDRQLEGLRHANAELIEALRAGEQRRATEFGLYARQRHRAYARVYRRYKIAATALAIC